MSFQCYASRASSRSVLIGALFLPADGTRRVVPDHWLAQAELLEGACLLRLSYTSCTIEVAGRGLGPIFEDASVGRLGTIRMAPPQESPDGQLWVTSIIVLAPAAPALPAFEEEHFDA